MFPAPYNEEEVEAAKFTHTYLLVFEPVDGIIQGSRLPVPRKQPLIEPL